MTFQTAVHSKSTLVPPTFPPLLLSSSKGFRDKRGKEQVFVGAVGGGVMHWSGDRLERDDTLIVHPTPQTYLHTRNVPQRCPNPLLSLVSNGGHQRGLAVDWRWNVKNSRSDRCCFPEEKP